MGPADRRMCGDDIVADDEGGATGPSAGVEGYEPLLKGPMLWGGLYRPWAASASDRSARPPGGSYLIP